MMLDTTTNLQRALALSSLGLFVIPCHPADIQLPSGKSIPAKSPRVLGGLYDATRDEEKIRRWWTSWPDSLIGVVAGPSGLVFLDGDNKNGKDFDTSLFEAGITPAPTWNYQTPSGGKHYVYAAPDGVTLNGVANYRGMLGVDRRGGPSYAIWWGEVPAWPEWSPAPQWLCDPVQFSANSIGYSGDTSEWLEYNDDEPSPLLLHIQKEDFSDPGEGEYEHDVALRLVVRIVTLAAEGERGATRVLEVLKEKYLDGYQEYEEEWNKIVEWAIRNCGGTPEEEVREPTTESSFIEAQSLLPSDFPLTRLSDPTITLGHLVALLGQQGLSPQHIVAIVTRLPRFSHVTAEQISTLIDPEAPETISESTGESTTSRHDFSAIPLLDDIERAEAQTAWNQSFLAEYEDWISESIANYNPPYHRAAAWNILSTLLGDFAWFRKGKAKVPLNLYTMTLGPSASGKTEARRAMQLVVHNATRGTNPDIGDNSSAEGLYEVLRARDGEPVLFNSDDADGLIREMSQNGSWRTGQLEKWTYLYDGSVPPLVRRGETNGQWTNCCFNMYMMGTEIGILKVLTRDMFEKGFLTRFCFFRSEYSEIPDEQKGFTEGDGDEGLDSERITQWQTRFNRLGYSWAVANSDKSTKRRITTDSADTLEYFRQKTAAIELGPLSKHRNWDIIKPSIFRLELNMYKMAALIAISDGRRSITKRDILIALLQGEELIENLIYMADGVSDSEHSKDLDYLEALILSQPGGAKSSEVYLQMARRGNPKREVDSYVDELKAQRRIRVEKGPNRTFIYIPVDQDYPE